MAVPLKPVTDAVLDYVTKCAVGYIVDQQSWAVGWTNAGVEVAKAKAISWIPTRGIVAQAERGSLVDSVTQFFDNIKGDVPNGYNLLAKAPLVFAPILYAAVLLSTRAAQAQKAT